MKIVKLHIADYPTQRPFCLFHFPLPVTPPLQSPSQQQTEAQSLASPTSFVTFYRLADIDIIFFDAAPGYLYHSGKIPAAYLESAGYFVRDQTGDAYLAAKALAEIAVKLSNYLLADFCKLTKDDILSGAADRLLNELPMLRRLPYIKEMEEDFEPARPDRRGETQLSSPPPAPHPIVKREPRSPSPPAAMTISPPPEPHQDDLEHTRLAAASVERVRREQSRDAEESSPTVTPRKRPVSSNPMAINQVLSGPDNNSTIRPRSTSPPMHRDYSSMSDDRASPDHIKQENQPVSVYSAPSPQGNSSSSPKSPASPTFGSTSSLAALLDDDPRIQKRRRVVIPPLVGGAKANNTDVMEQVRNTLKLKQQQKAIIESRQQQTQPSTPTSASGPQAILPKPPIVASNNSTTVSTSKSTAPAATSSLLSKRIISPRHNKNARNLTIFTPSYTEQHSVGIRSAPLVPTYQQKAGTRTAANGPVTSQPLLLAHQSQTLAPLLSPRAPILPPTKKIAPRTTMAQESSSRFGPNTPVYPLSSSASMSATSPRTAEFHPATSGSYSHVTVVPAQQYQHPLPSPSFYQSSQHHPASSTSTQLATVTTPVVSSMSALPLPTPSTTTTFSSLPKQTFLQPFENLFDNIETTRTLKSTLDDQIRRSSALMQTLQASATMIEGLVRGHFKDMQKEMMDKFDRRLEDLTKRLAVLEEREQRKEKESESDRAKTHIYHHHQQQYQHAQDKAPTRSSPSTPNTTGHHPHHLHYVPASPYASSPKAASFASSMSTSYTHSQQQGGALSSPLPSMSAPPPSAFTPTQSAFHRHQIDGPNAGNVSASPTSISSLTSRSSPVHSSNSSDQHSHSAHPLAPGSQGSTARQPSSSSSLSSNSSRLSKSPPEPPTIVRSQDDIKPRDYENVLRGLQERLDGLERRFDS